VTLSEMREAVWAYLGTTSTDRAYPAARVTRWLNDALNQIRADTPNSYFQQRATWAADSSTGRVYTLTSQSPSVTTLQRMVEVRLTSTTGPKLRELTYEQLPAWAGEAYAITGADESAVLTTSEGVPVGVALYVAYEAWPTELSAGSDTPSWLPSRFHDVPTLMATDVAFSVGDEGQMPGTLSAKMLDRQAQLLTHMRRRSGDVMLTRQPEAAVL